MVKKFKANYPPWIVRGEGGFDEHFLRQCTHQSYTTTNVLAAAHSPSYTTTNVFVLTFFNKILPLQSYITGGHGVVSRTEP